MSAQFKVTDSPERSALETLDKGLHSHNLLEPELANVRPLAVLARNIDNEIVGGANGRTWGECCELQQLWTAKDLRSKGIGSQVMDHFEQKAQQRGCSLIYLETFSFQARPFYAKLGYEVVLEIPGFTKGIVKYTMQKLLHSLPR